MFELDRFKRAQHDARSGFETALGELKQGRKRGHWIWYIFPQLAGLGHSSMAAHYGLQGSAEATAYLEDAILRGRLLAAARVVAAHLASRPATALPQLMGSEIDTLKLVSSMTLFREIAQRLNRSQPSPDLQDLEKQAVTILQAAAVEGYPACQWTLRALAADDRSEL
jgi:uncharacterized protein (DUF1810 family)